MIRHLLQKIRYRKGYSRQAGVRILQNSARCLVCTDALYTGRSPKIKVTCTCGNLTISGGTKALVRHFETDLWQETSRTVKE